MKETDRIKESIAEDMNQDTKSPAFNEKRAIQKRVAYASELFQGDITIRTLLESLAESVIIVDSAANIVFINSQTERLFGYQKEEIVGRPLNTLIPKKLHSAHEKHVDEYFKSPRVRPMGKGRDLIGHKKDGRDFPVEISLCFLEVDGNSLSMAFVTDITLRKKAEKDLKTRNEELDDFAHTVAHDLKGSLTCLLGYSELLSQPDVNLEKQAIRDSLDQICTSSRKMANIIDELLLLASVRKEDIEVTPLAMLSIVNDALLRLKSEAKTAGIEIILAADFPEALGHAPWIEEVWYNYITNAIKYGGDPAKIEIGGELQGNGSARFWVKDNGPGLTDVEQSCLFTAYALQKRKSGGHGLGLSIVKRIVVKLSGEVAVESQVGEGSLFSFTLPSA